MILNYQHNGKNYQMSAFFYIMILTHNQKVGFGISTKIHERVLDYVSQSGEELQSFKYLFYGDISTILSLEETLKKEWRKYLWMIFKGNKWKLELLDPKFNLTAEDVKRWVENKILVEELPVRCIKSEWLPYRGNKKVQNKFISLNQDMYLA